MIFVISKLSALTGMGVYSSASVPVTLNGSIHPH